MSTNEDLLRSDLTVALKARDAARVQVIRAVLAAAKNRAIELRVDRLSDSEITAVLKREAKQRAESLGFARTAGRDDLVVEHEAAIRVLERYLPQQMSEEQLRAAIDEILLETGARAIGPVMKELGARHAGRYDGKTASRLVAELVATAVR
jgi:uncharacterized protein YqeY